MVTLRALLLLPAAIACGCSLVWDIQPADLDTRDAAADSHNHADVNPAPGCQATGEACGDCLASSCCEQYNGCLADSTCNQALVTYDMCVGNGTGGSGSSCAETFGTANTTANALVQCAFLSTCKSDCSFKKLRSSCAEYCSCMAGACPSAVFPEGSCMQNCLLLSTPQLDCRHYHCQFATQDPAVHCGHALGPPVCP